MNKRSAAKASFADKAEGAAAMGRSIQAVIDRRDASKGKKSKSKAAMQAGQRRYPGKFPAQLLKKPGVETDLDLPPMFEAPEYGGSDKLKDCAALVTGGDSGIGRAAAVLFAREGCDVAVAYLDEHEDAEATKRAVDAEGRRCITLLGNKDLLDYSMTKGGIHAFARSLASHLVDRGIRVNVVAPGPVWTPLNPADRPAEAVATFGSDTPMKRAAQPEEIAPAFVFLAARSCLSYITGEILPVIGGYSGG
jgi:hypothetical protein